MAGYDEKSGPDANIDAELEKKTDLWLENEKKIYNYRKKLSAKSLRELQAAERASLRRQHDNGLISEEQYIEKLGEFRNRYLREGTKAYEDVTSEMMKARRENELEMLDFHLKSGVLTEAEYYQKLEEFRDKHFTAGSAEWLKYTQKIRDYHVEQIQSAYSEIADYAGKELGDVLKKQETLYKNLDKYRDLIHTVKIKNYYEDGGTLYVKELSDISRENQFLKQYDEAISKAASRIQNANISEVAAAKLYDELVSLAPEESLELADLLVRATDDAFEKYIQQYEENVKLLDTVSKNPFRKQWETAANNVEVYARETLGKLGAGVPETFSQIGEAAAENFDRSFAESLFALFDGASDDISIHKKLTESVSGAGKDAANGLVDALKEHGFIVPDAFGNLGTESAASFGEDFMSELKSQMENIKQEIVGWTVTITTDVERKNAGATTVYSPVYNLYGSGETDVARIQTAKAHAMRDHMAGGY